MTFIFSFTFTFTRTVTLTVTFTCTSIFTLTYIHHEGEEIVHPRGCQWSRLSACQFDSDFSTMGDEVFDTFRLDTSIKFHDAIQREALMVDIPHTAAGDAMLLGVATPTADSCVKDLGSRVQKDFSCSVTKFFLFHPRCCVGRIQQCSSRRCEVKCCFVELWTSFFSCSTRAVTFKLHLHLHPLLRQEGPGSSGCWTWPFTCSIKSFSRWCHQRALHGRFHVH